MARFPRKNDTLVVAVAEATVEELGTNALSPIFPVWWRMRITDLHTIKCHCVPYLGKPMSTAHSLRPSADEAQCRFDWEPLTEFLTLTSVTVRVPKKKILCFLPQLILSI